MNEKTTLSKNTKYIFYSEKYKSLMVINKYLKQYQVAKNYS